MTTSEMVRRKPKRSKLPFLLVLPAVAIILLSMGYPLVNQLLQSFQKFGLAQQFGQPPEFVWFQNYFEVFTTADFWIAFLRSAIFCAVCASITMALGMGGAVLLTKIPRPVAVFVQIALLLAWAMPVLSSLQSFQLMFSTRAGIVPWFTSLFDADSANLNWLSHPLTFFTVAGLQVIWMSVPLVVFMLYASITQIDESMLEAAQLDGATGWQRFRSIIMPSIAPVLLLVSLLEVIWDIRVFTQIFVLQASSGISDQTDVLGTYIYRRGIMSSDYGVASAASVVMLIVSLALTWRYIRQFMKNEEEA